MIAIVESGSTKSDWRILNGQGYAQQIITVGFNPYHIGASLMVDELLMSQELQALANQITEVYFYGAGCSSSEMNEVIASALRQVFGGAEVHVDHDLMGAVLAAGQGEESIVCILGTGSNACYFDGELIDNGRSSLGYILGDEAGGVWFGKRLMADHLHGLLPESMHLALNELGAKKELVLQRVYREHRANTYLASFMPVLKTFRTLEYTQDLLHEGMHAFLSRYVCAFPRYNEVPVHFVGSVAFHFDEELRSTAQMLGLKLGNIIQHPVNGLIEYHLNRLTRKG